MDIQNKTIEKVTPEVPVETQTPEQLFAQETGTQQTEEPTATADTPKPGLEKPVYNRDAILEKKRLARLSAEKRQMEQRLAAIEGAQKKIDVAKLRLADPTTPYAERVRILKETVGLDVDDLAESYIKTGDPASATTPKLDPKVAAIEAEIKELRAAQEKRAEEEARAAALREQSAHVQRATEFLTTNSDKYPLLSGLEKAPALVAEIRRMDESGELDASITLDDVATLLEERAESEIEKELKTLLTKPKFRALLVKLDTENKAAKPQSKVKATLTNRMSSAPKEPFDYSKATPAEIERYAREALNE
jgi:hypothetical protein